MAPLPGTVKKVKSRRNVLVEQEEIEVPESWREALRLLVADCKDDDVDDVLKAILTPLDGIETIVSARPRAVLAALCLADEPNISEQTAQQVLSCLTRVIGEDDGQGMVGTYLDRAILEVGNSIWSDSLKRALVEEFCRRPQDARWNVGGLWGMVEVSCWRKSGSDPQSFVKSLATRLQSCERVEVISAALTVMQMAYEDASVEVENLPECLLGHFTDAFLPTKFASVWALGWLSEEEGYLAKKRKSCWKAKGNETLLIAQTLDMADPSEFDTQRWLARIIGNCGDVQALPSLVRRLDSPDVDVRTTVIEALAKLGDRQAVAPLLAKLDDQDAKIRLAVIEALAKLGDRQAVAPLLAKLDDQDAKIRLAVIEALAKLGDKQATAPLLAMLNDELEDISVTAAYALHVLEEPRGMNALIRFLASQKARTRETITRAYARHRDILDKQLLSRDLDASAPWLDPKEPVTEVQIANASSRLNITPEQVRSRYEALAVDLKLVLEWKKT